MKTFDSFVDRHTGLNFSDDLKQMLDTIGVGTVEELLQQVIPQSIRLKKPLDLPAAMSEYEYANHIAALAAKNRTLRSFIGMGLILEENPDGTLMLLRHSNMLSFSSLLRG